MSTFVQEFKDRAGREREKAAEKLAAIIAQRDAEIRDVEQKYADEISAAEAELAELDEVMANFGLRSRTPSRGARRRRGSTADRGSRSKEVLELIKAHPGSTVSEIAAKMNIKPNYLYRVLPALEADGLVRKEDRGWHPADATPR
jgi:predicted Rossmann fold nucleotide-binding protein DprA/Smf involved in DNA uptake